MPTRPDARSAAATPGEAGAPDAGAPDPVAPPTAEAAGAADLPSRDQLTMAWGDHVLPQLRGMARALYSPGRFVESDGDAAVFALPANHPLHRCEPLRPEVEAALTGYFHRMVPLRLAVDDGQVARPPELGFSPADHLDDADMEGAPMADVPSPLEQLAQAFPGAEIVEDTNETAP